MNANETTLSGMKKAVLVLLLAACLPGVMGGCTVADDTRDPYLTIHGTTYPTRPAGPRDVANWLHIAAEVANMANRPRGHGRGHSRGHRPAYAPNYAPSHIPSNGGCGNH